MTKFIFRNRYIKIAVLFLVYATIAYLFMPLAIYSLRSYFMCYGSCSAARIVSAPWLYHNRTVTVDGFLRLKFEGNALYPLEEYYRYGLFKEGIWVNASKEIMAKKDAFDSKYVTITATFNALEHGHGDLFVGSLKEIKRIQIKPRLD